MAGKQFDVKQILAKAIAKEGQAHDFYLKAAGMVDLVAVKGLLWELAEFELEHEKLLKNMDIDAELSKGSREIEDLRISDFLEDKQLTEKAGFQDVMIYAIKREEKAHNFYVAMREKVGENTRAMKLFGRLADEELSHKNKLESAYDEIVYKEN